MKTRRRLIIVSSIGILLCLSGWFFLSASAQEEELDDVKEAVFREILPKNGTAYLSMGTTSSPFDPLLRFLHISTSSRELDPSDAFMRRLRDYKIILKKASEAESKLSGVVDKQTGQPAIIYSVEVIRRLSNVEYEIRAGYYCGGLCAEGCIYRVVLDQGHWRIKERAECWIS